MLGLVSDVLSQILFDVTNQTLRRSADVIKFIALAYAGNPDKFPPALLPFRPGHADRSAQSTGAKRQRLEKRSFNSVQASFSTNSPIDA
jgi:hypothetical protein